MNEHYDPKLPVLAELERDVTRAAERALGGKGGPAARRPVPSRSRGAHPGGKQGRRVVRRALVLVALALLVGATALAATGAFDAGGSDPAVRGPALEGIHGGAGGGYRVVLQAHGQALCRTLVLEGSVAAACQRPPHRDQVQAQSALGGGERFVFGVAGPGARSVEIRVGGRHVRVATRPVDAAAARATRIDPNVRIFVATFTPQSGASQPPAIVAGKADCSLTTVPAKICEAR